MPPSSDDESVTHDWTSGDLPEYLDKVTYSCPKARKLIDEQEVISDTHQIVCQWNKTWTTMKVSRTCIQGGPEVATLGWASLAWLLQDLGRWDW